VSDFDILPVIEQAQAAVEVRQLAEDYVGVVVPANGTLTQVDVRTIMDDRLPAPRRARGTVTLHTVDELATFVDEHYNASGTTVWVSEQQQSVVAVLNDHSMDGTGWRDHRADLTLERSDQWKHWTNRDGTLGSQEAFAEHIEDGLAEIVRPDGADLLELAQSFHATTSATFRSARRLSSGEVKIVYDEEVQATAGQAGDLTIPDTFDLAMPVFIGEAPVHVVARLKYRLNQGNLTIGYRLVRPNEAVRETVQAIAERLRTRFARVYLGDAFGSTF
jgi:uncharacterized protein YfdQ (DUF2303 family)